MAAKNSAAEARRYACWRRQPLLGGDCLGFPEQALAQSNAAIAEARRLAHPPSLSVGLTNGAAVLLLVGDNAILGECVDQLVAVTTEQGFPFWRAQGTIYRGWVKIKNG